MFINLSRNTKAACASMFCAMLLLLSAASPASADQAQFSGTLTCTTSTGYSIYVRSTTVSKTIHSISPSAGGFRSWYKGFSAYPFVRTTNTQVQVGFAGVHTYNYGNVISNILDMRSYCST